MEYLYKHFQYQPPTQHIDRVALHHLLKTLIQKLQRFQKIVCEALDLEPILGLEGYSELYVFDQEGLAMHIYPATDNKTVCIKYRKDDRFISLVPKLISFMVHDGWVEIDDLCEVLE